MQMFLSLMLTLAFGAPHAHGQGAFSGIYVGSMHLVDGEERDIPLAVSLNLTDETISTPTGNQNVIDGSLLVDEEGGPYTFVKVTYNLDENRLDMKYSRPRGDPTETSPASLRLIGKFDADDNLSGSVTSGLYGPIGTFKIKRNADLHALPYRRKYVGMWAGHGFNVAVGRDKDVTVQLNVSASATQNPPDYEFDYTPGRLGGLSMNGTPLDNFSQVVIDYLRRKIIMIDQGAHVTLDLKVDGTGETITGSQTTGYYGLTTVFDPLTKVH